MSEEEQKAIKWLKELYDIEKDFNSSAGKEESNIIKTLLNLIEKKENKIASLEKQIKLMQSCDLAKEIRKLQEEIEERETRLQEEINENCKLKYELYGNSISKDEIRDKIKQLEQIKNAFQNDEWKREYNYRIGTLKELLKE